MSPELQARLKNVANLPSPPGVAAEIIRLAQDPNLELEDVAEKLINDPALSAKILKIARYERNVIAKVDINLEKMVSRQGSRVPIRPWR